MSVPTDELAAEIENDPAGLGYAGLSDAEIASLLNDPSAVDSTVLRSSIPMGEIYAQVEWIDEWLGLGSDRKKGFQQLTSTPSLDASSVRIRDALEAIFGNTSQTWSNLSGIASRSASRAEALWGEGATVHHLDVAAAR